METNMTNGEIPGEIPEERLRGEQSREQRLREEQNFREMMEFIDDVINNPLSQHILYVIDLSFNNIEKPQTRTVSKEQFEKISTLVSPIIYEDQKESCVICFEEFEEARMITKLNCGHHFHSECIRSWLCDYKSNCPVCRMDYGLDNNQ